jgi:hypothetical protein
MGCPNLSLCEEPQLQDSRKPRLEWDQDERQTNHHGHELQIRVRLATTTAHSVATVLDLLPIDTFLTPQ